MKKDTDGQETDQQKQIKNMKQIWFSAGWSKPEQKLVVAEFGEFVWIIPTATARQNSRDEQHIVRKDFIFQSEFEAVSNQLRHLRKLKDEEYEASERLFRLTPKA